MNLLEDWWIPRERVGLCSSDMIFKKIKLTVFAVYTHDFFFLGRAQPYPFQRHLEMFGKRFWLAQYLNGVTGI